MAKSALVHFPPLLLLALRFVLTALVLVWFFRPPWAYLKRIFWAALVGSTLMYSLMFIGLKQIDASLMIIVVQLQVPFASILAWFAFKDRLGWSRFAGVVLAFVGVGLIAGSPEERSELLGVMLVIMGAFVWAIGQMLFKRLASIGGLPLITWVAVMSGPQLLLCSWLFEDDQLLALSTATPNHWLAVAYLVLAMTVLGYGSWYFLLGRYDVNQVVPFLFLEPVATVLGGVLILSETLTTTRLLGGALVMGGVALITLLTETRKERGVKSARDSNL